MNAGDSQVSYFHTYVITVIGFSELLTVFFFWRYYEKNLKQNFIQEKMIQKQLDDHIQVLECVKDGIVIVKHTDTENTI